MPGTAQRRCFSAALLLLAGCHTVDTGPTTEAPRRESQARVLGADDEALLATLLADDPGDYQVQRARVWRYGPLRWVDGGPELGGRPDTGGDVPEPFDVVVFEEEGPRVLLPLDQFSGLGAGEPGGGELVRVSRRDDQDREPPWSALRLLAVPRSGDLVAGLRHELSPTPWLTVAAGVAVSPVDREGDRLRVRWADPRCGFSLQLAIDPEDFGPLYEPGPAGSPSDVDRDPGPVLQLAPGTPIFTEAVGGKPVLRTTEDEPRRSERSHSAQHVHLDGSARGGRQPIRMQCRGVQVRGWVSSRHINESPARVAVLDRPRPPAMSECEAAGGSASAEVMTIIRGTVLYEPRPGRDAAVIGVAIADAEILAEPAQVGWWQACVPSPWGDLRFQFQPQF